jgi:hypothetical protein
MIFVRERIAEGKVTEASTLRSVGLGRYKNPCHTRSRRLFEADRNKAQNAGTPSLAAFENLLRISYG